MFGAADNHYFKISTGSMHHAWDKYMQIFLLQSP